MRDGLVEALADAGGLRMTRPGSGMFDAVHTRAEPVIMRFQLAAVFRAPIRQDADNPHLL